MTLLVMGLVIVSSFFISHLYFESRPSRIADNSEDIYRFFSLPKDQIEYCYDEIHSQGRDVFDFGSAHYSLKIAYDNSLLQKTIMENENTVITDSTMELTVRKGNILGRFILDLNSNEAHVHYNQLYED